MRHVEPKSWQWGTRSVLRRPNSFELVAGKDLVRKTVHPAEFEEFVTGRLFGLRGWTTKRIESGVHLAKVAYLPGIALEGNSYVEQIVTVSTGDNVRAAMEAADANADRYGGAPFLVSFYGASEDERRWKGTLVDGFLLQHWFFPLVLNSPDGAAAIFTIKRQWADMMFPKAAQATLGPFRLQLRHENVYFSKFKGGVYEAIRPGSHVLWYISEAGSHLRGDGLVKRRARGSAGKLSRMFEGKGAWRREDVVEALGEEEGMAIEFTWYRELPREVPIADVMKVVPNYNPITSMVINGEQYERLRSMGGLD